MRIVPIDKYGWPVERIIGRPITNFLRILIHTREIITKQEWEERMQERESQQRRNNPVAYSKIETENSS